MPVIIFSKILNWNCLKLFSSASVLKSCQGGLVVEPEVLSCSRLRQAHPDTVAGRCLHIDKYFFSYGIKRLFFVKLVSVNVYRNNANSFFSLSVITIFFLSKGSRLANEVSNLM